jgi:hypothetical protein
LPSARFVKVEIRRRMATRDNQCVKRGDGVPIPEDTCELVLAWPRMALKHHAGAVGLPSRRPGDPQCHCAPRPPDRGSQVAAP